MNSPQFKGGGVAIFNKKINFNEFRAVDARSLLGLYVSQTLLFLGILLILFNNADIVEPGNYLGSYGWLTVTVFSIGLLINFVSIPFLYFSSLSHFKRENEFWDKETFWILPLFFFGTFFLYSSQIYMALILLALSVLVIMIIHVIFVIEARQIVRRNSDRTLSNCGQYLMTLKYLSAYYFLLLGLLISVNPLGYFFNWIHLY
ncbi:MAG: hypothetical protein HGA36_02405 [Candidatus Moranbacteria bacterium]|nr:hypothetical protein [Candidatus Moranbacteria bacterium]